MGTSNNSLSVWNKKSKKEFTHFVLSVFRPLCITMQHDMALKKTTVKNQNFVFRYHSSQKVVGLSKAVVYAIIW